MWDREADLAVDLLKRAGLGERLEKYTSPNGRMVVLTCHLPYLRFSDKPEYMLFSIIVSPFGTISSEVAASDTGKCLHFIPSVECNEIGVRAVIAELLDWWKQNRTQKRAFA